MKTMGWVLCGAVTAAAVAQRSDSGLSKLAKVAKRLPAETALRELDRLAAQARACAENEQLTKRLFSIRCLGLLAKYGRAQPEDFVRLTKALEDEWSAVRWVTLKALESARFPDRKLMRSARTALHRCSETWPEDVALDREAKRLRVDLLAQLRPATPGAGESQVESEHEESKPAVPSANSRKRTNESIAVAVLKNLCSSQAQVQASGMIDVDRDGRGEFGYFAELTGTTDVRGDEKGEKAATGRRVVPPVLSGRFAKVRSGVVVFSGYCFCIFLPGRDAIAVPEAQKGGWKGCAVVADQAETRWCVYAWPMTLGKNSRRVYFTDQAGDVLACDNAFADYAGLDRRPDAGAARQATKRGLSSLAVPRAVNAIGRDGNHWYPAN